MTDHLPDGFRVALDPGTRRLDDGRVLVGGSPLRLVRLRAAGARAVDALAAGTPVPAADNTQRLVRRLLDNGMVHPRPAGTAFGHHDVTVVVPVRDRAAELQHTLAALGPVASVVVVDDGSRRPVPGALRHDTPRGPAAARNTGWRAATTALVAFVDADCEPEPGWLGPLVAHFDDPRVGAVAPRITPDVAAMPSRWLAAYEAARSPLDLGPAESPVRPRARVPYVPTAALVVRREALEAIGGFDEAMRVGEDVDVVWRLHDAGWRVRYEPASHVRHPARDTATSWVRQRFDYGTSAAPLDARHPGEVAPLEVSGWSAGAWSLAVAGHPVAGAAVAATTTALLAPKLRPLDHPWREAARLAGLGHLFAGRRLADAVVRPWWPLAVAAAVPSRRWRRVLVAVATVPALVEWAEERPRLDPLRWTLARRVDDAAYGLGVWVGCARARSFGALRPGFVNWPGRDRG